MNYAQSKRESRWFNNGDTVVILFRRQYAHTPKKIAVQFGIEESMTHENLEMRSNQVARCLCTLGSSEGTIIPFCLAKSSLLSVLMLAIMKTGAAYTSIDSVHSVERKRKMLHTIKPPFLLTQALFTEEVGCDVRLLPEILEKASLASTDSTSEMVLSSQLAYVYLRF